MPPGRTLWLTEGLQQRRLTGMTGYCNAMSTESRRTLQHKAPVLAIECTWRPEDLNVAYGCDWLGWSISGWGVCGISEKNRWSFVQPLNSCPISSVWQSSSPTYEFLHDVIFYYLSFISQCSHFTVLRLKSRTMWNSLCSHVIHVELYNIR